MNNETTIIIATTTPIMDTLSGANIVNLSVDENEIGTGKILITEACDYYFEHTLTKEQYIALGNEILNEAKKL